MIVQQEDVLKIGVRNSSGETVPLGAFTTVRDKSGPYRVPRYNSIRPRNSTAPPRRVTPGPGDRDMEQLARRRCRRASAYEWTTLAYQQIRAGNTASSPSCWRGVRLPGAGGAV